MSGTLRSFVLAVALLSAATQIQAQSQPRVYTRADTLRGSWTTPGRIWWDAAYYDLNLRISPRDSTVEGYNAITYRVLQPGREMQIDLQEPLVVDSIVQDGRALTFRRDGNAFFATHGADQSPGALKTVKVFYHGKPRVAVRPPWDGGITWAADSLGRPLIVTTDQGIGASVYWPNKDTQADEPDSMRIAFRVPDPLKAIANGRQRGTTRHPDGTTTYEWFVANPINNYAIAVNAGNYVHYNEVFQGEKGPLTMDYWVLDYNLEKAKRQFTQARTMMKCFEHWFGPYPFYKDGFKLIDVDKTYPGMEHQSAVTYGNYYENGYRRRDGSGTGLGLKWDFIIVHESAHEWFANNITAKDQADMWVHESFANYMEGIYTECLFGKEAGSQYVIGTRRGIQNDRPIQPAARGVNAQGSGDMYPKGGNMLHTIRQIVDNDQKWRGILRGLGATFGHKTVLGSEIEQYISRESGADLSKVFDQYLRQAAIPVFEYQIADGQLRYRWSGVVPGFNMPIKVSLSPGGNQWIKPTTEWQSTSVRVAPTDFKVDANFYVDVKAVN